MRPSTWPLLKRRVVYVASFHLQWLALLLLVASVVIVLASPKEGCIRWWGMGLQLVGVYAVVRELVLTQAKHGLGFREWWSKVKAGWPRRAGTMYGRADGMASATAFGFGSARPKTINPAEPIEARVATLEAHAAFVLQSVERVEKAQFEDRRKAEEALRQEAQLRSQAIAQIQADSKASDEARLPFSLFGVACLFLGVILGTGSVEIHGWVQLWLR